MDSDLMPEQLVQMYHFNGENSNEFLLGTNPDTVQSPSYLLNKSALQNAVER
jgi:hypothetical protein